MAVSDAGPEPEGPEATGFDTIQLVTRKPSALPRIYEYVVEQGRTTPNALQEHLDVSGSVVHSNLRTLRDIGLVEKVGHGVYSPAVPAIDPDRVRTLGELRSVKQYGICRAASDVNDVDVAVLSERVGGSRSNVRAAAVRLAENGFLEKRRAPFENSRKRYRLSDEGRRSLEALDVDRYRGWDSRETVAHDTGIDGTEFRTAYEIEDAHHLSQADDEWIHPHRVAETLEKNGKKTQRRFAKMADRDLLERTAEPRKMVFSATRKTRSLCADLDLYDVSRTYELDLYSVARDGMLPEPFTLKQLYAALVKSGANPAVTELNDAKEVLKDVGVLDGDPLTGYSFAIE